MMVRIGEQFNWEQCCNDQQIDHSIGKENLQDRKDTGKNDEQSSSSYSSIPILHPCTDRFDCDHVDWHIHPGDVMGVPKLTKPTERPKSHYQKKTNNPRMGRPKIEYQDHWTKYSMKRPKYTSAQFHAQKNECRVCGGTHFLHERPMGHVKSYYKTYGYRTERIQWRIRCINGRCSEPYGVILKLEHWDSAGE